MKMKKRGFTLIELLAVIVVLAIIALIATPIVVNTIEKSKKKTAIESANNLIHTAEIYFMTTTPRYGKIDVLDSKLNYNGKKPDLGEVEINKEGKTRIYTYINGYCVTKEYETETYASKTNKDNCSWYGTDNYETQEGTIFTLNNKNIKNYLIYGNSTQQTRSGKNLFNIDSIITNTVIANGTAEKINNGWSVKGNLGNTSSGSNAVFANGWFRPGWYKDDGKVYIEEGTIVTISADIKLLKLSENISIENNFSNIYLYGADGVTSYIKNNSQRLTVNETKRVYQTYTIKKSGYYFPVFTVNNNELEITNIQIEEGSSATEYEEYGAMPSPEYPSEIKSTGDLITSSNCSSYGSDACNNIGKYVIQAKSTGKNLFNINTAEKNKGLVWKSGLYYNLDKSVASDFIQIKNNVNYISKYKMQVILYDKDFNYINSLDESNPRKSFVITDQNCKYIKVAFRPSDNLQQDFTSTEDIMLEESNNATNYEAYKEPVITNIYLEEPLRKIGDYVDYIDFENKKVVRNVGTVTFNGTENWNYEVLSGNKNNFYIKLTDSKANEPVSSNMFKYANKIDEPYTCKVTNTKNFNMRYQDYSNVTDLKTKLKELYDGGKPLYSNYVLENPTETSINLPNIDLLSGNNKLSINSEIQPSNIKLITTK